MASRPIQAPGMMRHGPFPGPNLVGHQLSEPLPPPELLENKMAMQAAELDRLALENRRLAATHVTLRQELLVTHQESQRLHSRVGSEQMESDIRIRGLSEKIAKMEADVRTGESVKRELQQAHLEAQSIVTAKQELTAQMQQMTEELQKSCADIKMLPELHAELEGLRQEHQKLRTAFEFEKGSNIEQVEKMQVMEKNLISMAREVEKLRAEVLNAEKRARASNPYESTYGSAEPAYQPVGQATSYASTGYGQGVAYPDAGHSHGGAYLNGGFGQVGHANYADAYGRPLLQMSTMAAEGTDPYGGVPSVGAYDAARGALPSA